MLTSLNLPCPVLFCWRCAILHELAFNHPSPLLGRPYHWRSHHTLPCPANDIKWVYVIPCTSELHIGSFRPTPGYRLAADVPTWHVQCGFWCRCWQCRCIVWLPPQEKNSCRFSELQMYACVYKICTCMCACNDNPQKRKDLGCLAKFLRKQAMG